MENKMCEAICKSTQKPCNNQSKGSYEDKCYCNVHLKSIRAKEECVICFEAMSPATALKLGCNHVFHKHCMVKWGEQSDQCPLCREKLDVKSIMAINKDYMDMLSYCLFSIPSTHRPAIIQGIEEAIFAYYDNSYSS